MVDLAAVELEGGGVGEDGAAPRALEPLHAPLLCAARALLVVRARDRERRLLARGGGGGVGGVVEAARGGGARADERGVVLPGVQQVHRAAAVAVPQRAHRLARRDDRLDAEVLGEHDDLGLAAPVHLVADPLAVRGDRVVAEQHGARRRIRVRQHRRRAHRAQLAARRLEQRLRRGRRLGAELRKRGEEAGIVGSNRGALQRAEVGEGFRCRHQSGVEENDLRVFTARRARSQHRNAVAEHAPPRTPTCTLPPPVKVDSA